ncbi:MAG: 50S ribosomal protein L18 [Bacteriovoracaceae bacterium]|nr:50S ribosomal protein L18 [Bacteriovoracaceae bacterium]
MRKPNGKVKSESERKRLRRKLSIRKIVSGDSERPRVCITKSSKNLFVQVVNDEESKTLFSVQTFGKKAIAAKANKDGAKLVGAKVAEELKGKNISRVVFDRSGYKYHGVIAALADSIRENGIQV